MNISRRGFIQALTAAAVGQAVFDPLNKLWVPTSPEQRVAALMDDLNNLMPYVYSGGNKAASLLVERLSELDDMATEFAKLMAERLDSRALILREVEFRAPAVRPQAPVVYKVQKDGTVIAGTRRRVQRAISPICVLDVEEEGTGVFDGRRFAAGSLNPRTTDRNKVRDTYLAPLSGEVSRFMRRDKADMVAPMGRELRPGVPFSPDTQVGIGVDPSTGLVARVVQSYNVASRQKVLHAEIAGGHWHRKRKQPRDYSDPYNEFYS